MYHIIVGNALTIKALWISKRIFSKYNNCNFLKQTPYLQKNPEFLHCSTPVQVTNYFVNQTKISQIYGIQYVVTSDSIVQGI